MADADHDTSHTANFWHGRMEARIDAIDRRLSQLESTLSFLVKESATLWVESKKCEVIYAEMDKRTTGHFETQQIALDKAEQALSLRLEAMNEFRDQITQERALYVTRDQLDLSMKVLTAAVQPLHTAQTFIHGRDMTLLSIVTFALALAALVLPFVLRK